MTRTITLSAVVALLLSSVAFGQIDLQFQGWTLGVTNDINLSGGPGSASTIQGVGTLNTQNTGINPDQNGDPTVTATQGIIGGVFQAGGANTGGAAVGVVQTLGVTGLGLSVNGQLLPEGQTQMIGDLAGPTLQYQGASVSGGQILSKQVGSSGDADGLNLVGFGMGQASGNNCAESCQLSVILGGQYSELDGAAQSVGVVQTTMTATVQQLQMANGV